MWVRELNLGGSVPPRWALQADGKLVVAGDFFSTFNNVPRHNVARLNVDGSPSIWGFDALTGPNDVVFIFCRRGPGRWQGCYWEDPSRWWISSDAFMVARLQTNGLVDTELGAHLRGGQYRLCPHAAVGRQGPDRRGIFCL